MESNNRVAENVQARFIFPCSFKTVSQIVGLFFMQKYKLHTSVHKTKVEANTSIYLSNTAENPKSMNRFIFPKNYNRPALCQFQKQYFLL